MSRPSVFEDMEIEASQPTRRAREGRVEKAVKPAPTKAGNEMFRTSLYLTRAVHDVLREIAFTERKKVHELFVEGIDHVLKSRRHPTTREINDSVKAS